MSHLDIFETTANGQKVVIDIMVEKVVSLKEQLLAAKKTNNNLAEAIEKITKEKVEMEKASQELINNSQKVSDEFERLNRIIKTAEAGNENLYQDNNYLVESVKKQEDKITKQAAEIERLKKLLSDGDEDYAKVKKENHKLRQDKKALEYELGNAEEALEIKDEVIENHKEIQSQMAKEIDEKDIEIRNHKSHKKDMVEKIDFLTNDLAKSNNRVENLQDEIDRLVKL